MKPKTPHSFLPFLFIATRGINWLLVVFLCLVVVLLLLWLAPNVPSEEWPVTVGVMLGLFLIARELGSVDILRFSLKLYS